VNEGGQRPDIALVAIIGPYIQRIKNKIAFRERGSVRSVANPAPILGKQLAKSRFFDWKICGGAARGKVPIRIERNHVETFRRRGQAVIQP